MLSIKTSFVQVRDELEQLLDDDDDMSDLFLTRKMVGGTSPVTSSGAIGWAPASPTFGSRISRISKASTVTSFNHGIVNMISPFCVLRLWKVLVD